MKKTFDWKIISAAVSLLVLIGTGLLLHLNADDIFPVPEKIIYIPGWQSKNTSQEKQLALLKKIFPNSEVVVREWESIGPFSDCERRADQIVAPRLAQEIEALSPQKKKKLILVGHSLGGRIAIKAMSRLNGPIQRGIFLAAAIPNDDPDIARALRNSILPNINIYNRGDSVLRKVYTCDDPKNALGAYGYAFPFLHRHLMQFKNLSETDDFSNHLSIYYLKYLAEHREILFRKAGSDFPDRSTEYASVARIEVLQDKPNPPTRIIEGIGKWEILDTAAEWRLERRNGVCRIIDPYDYQRAHGSEEKMRRSFDRIKQQLGK